MKHFRKFQLNNKQQFLIGILNRQIYRQVGSSFVFKTPMLAVSFIYKDKGHGDTNMCRQYAKYQLLQAWRHLVRKELVRFVLLVQMEIARSVPLCHSSIITDIKYVGGQSVFYYVINATDHLWASKLFSDVSELD